MDRLKIFVLVAVKIFPVFLSLLLLLDITWWKFYLVYDRAAWVAGMAVFSLFLSLLWAQFVLWRREDGREEEWKWKEFFLSFPPLSYMYVIFVVINIVMKFREIRKKRCDSINI